MAFDREQMTALWRKQHPHKTAEEIEEHVDRAQEWHTQVQEKRKQQQEKPVPTVVQAEVKHDPSLKRYLRTIVGLLGLLCILSVHSHCQLDGVQVQLAGVKQKQWMGGIAKFNFSTGLSVSCSTSTCTITNTSAGGSMTWPAGGAGVPNYNGSSAWGTSYSAANPFPANFIPTLNQNTTGTAAGLSGSQIANYVYAAPNGSAGTAAFRLLVAADIPSLSQTATINGVGCALNSSCTVADATKVPTTTTVNGHALSTNVVVSASDLTTGTLPHAQLPTLISGDIPNNAANTTGSAASLSGSQTANYFYAAPNGSAGVGAWRAIVAADIPTLNQSTTGSAGSFTGSLAGDVTGTQGATVVGKINGVSLAGLATGILKNTTGTGVPSIAAGSDINTLIQGLTGCTTATYVYTPQGNDCVAQSAGFANPMTTLGDIIYGGTAGAGTRLAGNTAATDKVLVSHGTGSVAAAPSYSNAPALSAANMTSFPTLNQNTTGSAASFTGSLAGDVTGTQGATVVGKINGGSVPTSAAILGSNSSGQPIAATAHGSIIPFVCADTSASGTAQVCNTTPTFTPVANDCVTYTTTTSNTGTALTLNVNSLGAKPVAKWQNVTTLAANDVRANTTQRVCYDGTNWELTTVPGNAPTGGAANNAGWLVSFVNSTVSAAGNTYALLSGTVNGGTEGTYSTIAPVSCTASRFYATFYGVQPTATPSVLTANLDQATSMGGSYTTIYTLTVATSGQGGASSYTTSSDLTSNISIVAGDAYSWKLSNSDAGAASAKVINISFQCQ